MTIAIGLLVKEGVVLAADTQETAPGFMKTDAIKIHYYSHHVGGLMVSGAGSGNYIDAIAPQLDAAFAKAVKQNDTTIVDLLQQDLKAFYGDHITPFAQFPDHDRPTLQLVVGFQRRARSTPQLLVSDRTTLHSPYHFAAVGAGEVFAHSLLSQFYHPTLSIGAAERLAAYVVYRVKANIADCGHLTHVVSISSGHCHPVHPIWIRDSWEVIFEEFDETSAAALHYVLGYEDGPVATKINTYLADMRTVLAKDIGDD